LTIAALGTLLMPGIGRRGGVLRFLVWAISAALRPRALLVAENVCLRQQLGVLQRRLWGANTDPEGLALTSRR
jgi:hypothetical protein